MATTVAPAPPAAEEAPPKKKGKKKFLVVGLVVLLALAGGAYKFVLKKKPAATDAKPTPGVMVSEPEQTINLAGSHYLQVRVALQLVKGVSAKQLDADHAEVVDTVLRVFAGQSMSRLQGSGGLAWSRAHVLAALSPEFPAHTFYAVYFTQFVMQ